MGYLSYSKFLHLYTMSSFLVRNATRPGNTTRLSQNRNHEIPKNPRSESAVRRPHNGMLAQVHSIPTVGKKQLRRTTPRVLQSCELTTYRILVGVAVYFIVLLGIALTGSDDQASFGGSDRRRLGGAKVGAWVVVTNSDATVEGIGAHGIKLDATQHYIGQVLKKTGSSKNSRKIRLLTTATAPDEHENCRLEVTVHKNFSIKPLGKSLLCRISDTNLRITWPRRTKYSKNGMPPVPTLSGDPDECSGSLPDYFVQKQDSEDYAYDHDVPITTEMLTNSVICVYPVLS